MSGGGTTYHTGTNSYGDSYSGTSYSTPTYGVVGSETVSYTFYDHWASIDIFQGKEKVLRSFQILPMKNEIDLTYATITFIDSLFVDFPGSPHEDGWRDLDYEGLKKL